jgi:hypothetical protein
LSRPFLQPKLRNTACFGQAQSIECDFAAGNGRTAANCGRVRPQDARYLHEQNAAEQPGARAFVGYSAVVRRRGEPQERRFWPCWAARAVRKIQSAAANIERYNRRQRHIIERHAGRLTAWAVHLRFFVARTKTRIIGGKTYKARAETTDCRQYSMFIKITKQAIWDSCVLGTTDAYIGRRRKGQL